MLKPPPKILKDVIDKALEWFDGYTFSVAKKRKDDLEDLIFPELYEIYRKRDVLFDDLRTGKIDMLKIPHDDLSVYLVTMNKENIKVKHQYRDGEVAQDHYIKTFEDLQNQMRSELYDQAQYKKEILELDELLKICKPSDEIDFKGDLVKDYIPVNIKGWEYLPQIAQKLGEDPANIQKMVYETVCLFTLVFENGLGSCGEENYVTKSINLNQACFSIHSTVDLVKKFKQKRKYLIDVCYHEVLHLTQDLMDTLLKLKQKSGLPKPENKDFENYNYYGFSKDEDGVNRLEHALRDVEHFPRLQDEISELKSVLKRIRNPSKKKQIFEWWVGITDKKPSHIDYNREFFLLMKKNRPNRWKTTVRELYKAIFQ
jgi:hypothetical protein